MRSGICPKCRSASVHFTRNGIRRGQAFGLTVRGAWSTAQSEDFVCTSCGYFEQYFTPGGTLQKIAEKWPLIRPANRSQPGDR
ncbi:putative nucleic-acid-binding Zn-ribbon protein [Streptacidiphilus sp. MAP12-20]|uniref:hypothetical protein n=1 Tax=Streptacidiphilus sp. MAP12-20 TaxID=3156299 RepID=UPI0035172E94